LQGIRKDSRSFESPEVFVGLERAAVSAKVSPEIEEFLYEWAKGLRPYKVSSSALLEQCADIVRIMVRRGELSLEPKALQEFLENGRNGSNESKRSKEKAQ
jgi:hypothetical protein